MKPKGKGALLKEIERKRKICLNCPKAEIKGVKTVEEILNEQRVYFWEG